MSSYRKPRQLTPESYRSLIDVLTVDQFAAGGEAPDGTVFLEIRTLEGVMRASQGDWIIWGFKGEVWPVRADIFAETYERVPDSEAGVEERIARSLAAHDYLVPDEEFDDHWRNGCTPGFRENYLAHARRVIALVRAEDQPAAARADRAVVLAEEAEHLRTVLYPAVYDDAGQAAAEGVSRAAGELRRRARAARRVAVETGEEQPATTRRVLTADEHSTAWHAIEGSAGADGACPGTVLTAVLSALGIEAPAPPTTPEHVGGRVNAEDCPACSVATTPPPYPFICPGPDVVAYRSRDGRQLRCLAHAPGQNLVGLDWAALTALQVDGDARTCTQPECSVDVLADGQPS